MDTCLLDGANLLLRWAHVIFAIAWIGSSFCFVFLDNSLTPPADPALRDKGVTGERWAVHGGGFHHPQKYLVAPRTMPEHLHWFFWESYAAWLSGVALFAVLYLLNARGFLIDKTVHDWSPTAAVAAALGLLVSGWFVDDSIGRAFGQRKHGDLIVGVGLLVFVAGVAWLACALFAGRAACVLVGAMLATAMSANVLVWIIPGQRTVVALLKAGQPVEAIHGWRAKQRNVHNTCFTLAVPALVPAPPSAAARQAAAQPASFQAVQAVITQRCTVCHNAAVQNKGVALHTPALILQHAQAVYPQAAVLRQMPMNNATQITDAERALIRRWFEAGARADWPPWVTPVARDTRHVTETGVS